MMVPSYHAEFRGCNRDHVAHKAEKMIAWSFMEVASPGLDQKFPLFLPPSHNRMDPI